MDNLDLREVIIKDKNRDWLVFAGSDGHVYRSYVDGKPGKLSGFKYKERFYKNYKKISVGSRTLRVHRVIAQ